MRPAWRAAVGEGKYCLNLEWHMVLPQAGHHFAYAVLPHNLKFRNVDQKLSALGINEVTQDVEFITILFCGEFCSSDKFNSGRLASGASSFATFDGIVVGQS